MDLLQKFKRVTTFIFDMDGVLTDGSLIVMSGEKQLRRMHVKDGLGLQMAIKNGYKVLVVSGGSSDESRERLVKLGLENIHMSIPDKKEFVSLFIDHNSIKWEEVLFMGDDLPDIDLMRLVGVSCCPADAIGEIREFADYISPVNGGWGCVRDVIEKVLKVNGNWNFGTDVVSK